MRSATLSLLFIGSLSPAWFVAGADVADAGIGGRKQPSKQNIDQKEITINPVVSQQEEIMSEAELLAFILEASDEEVEFLLEPEDESMTGKGWF